jgi:hypothetical protein
MLQASDQVKNITGIAKAHVQALSQEKQHISDHRFQHWLQNTDLDRDTNTIYNPDTKTGHIEKLVHKHRQKCSLKH